MYVGADVLWKSRSGHTGDISAVSQCSALGVVATASRDGGLIIWRCETRRPVLHLQGPTERGWEMDSKESELKSAAVVLTQDSCHFPPESCFYFSFSKTNPWGFSSDPSSDIDKHKLCLALLLLTERLHCSSVSSRVNCCSRLVLMLPERWFPSTAFCSCSIELETEGWEMVACWCHPKPAVSASGASQDTHTPTVSRRDGRGCSRRARGGRTRLTDMSFTAQW